MKQLPVGPLDSRSERPAMRLCDPSCDRQTKSGPARARVQANESIEDASLMRERNAVAIIGHTNGGFAVSSCERR